MKVGDLVAHNPSASGADAIMKIYEDWGHTPDFDAGIIIKVKESFCWVLPSRPGKKPSWYMNKELTVLSESR